MTIFIARFKLHGHDISKGQLQYWTASGTISGVIDNLRQHFSAFKTWEEKPKFQIERFVFQETVISSAFSSDIFKDTARQLSAMDVAQMLIEKTKLENDTKER